MSSTSREAFCRVAQAGLDLAVAFDAYRQLDSRGFAFDMGEDGVDLRDLGANLVFDAANEIVGCAERHSLVDLDVLFDVEFALDGLHADVVQDDVVARGDGADFVEDTFSDGLAGNCMNDHIGIRG
jgi:hypothetical protein